MRKKRSYVIMGLLLAAFLAGAACSHGQKVKTEAAKKPAPAAAQEAEKHLEVDFSLSCLECHTEETPEVVKEWSAGMHGQVNVGCFVCHGDGDVEFYPRPGVTRCIGCHSGYGVDFSQHAGIESCFTCHNGHTLKFHKGDTGGFGALLPKKLPRS